jgi:hypothetical protein
MLPIIRTINVTLNSVNGTMNVTAPMSISLAIAMATVRLTQATLPKQKVWLVRRYPTLISAAT